MAGIFFHLQHSEPEKQIIDRFCRHWEGKLRGQNRLLVTDSTNVSALREILSQSPDLVIAQLVNTEFSLNPAFELAHDAEFAPRFRMFHNVNRNLDERNRLLQFLGDFFQVNETGRILEKNSCVIKNPRT